MASAANILQRQFKGKGFYCKNVQQYLPYISMKELIRSPVPGFVVDLKDDNIFEW